MLVLTRRRNEAVLMRGPLGDLITVRVLDLADGRVRLGIDAADDIQIWRPGARNQNRRAVEQESRRGPALALAES
ncbi:MAG: carbon storage regulator [Thermoguttaceae bacterium]|jgi:carbon storage regulator CsrA